MWQLSSCWVWVSYLFNQEAMVLIRLPEYGLACVSCKSVGFQSGVYIRTVVLVFRRRIRHGMVDVWHWQNWGDEACCCHRDSQRVSNWSAWMCILRAAESWWGSSVCLSMAFWGEHPWYMHGLCMFLRFLSHASLYNLPIASLASCHIYFVVPDLEGHGPWSYLVFLSLELFFSLGGTVTHWECLKTLGAPIVYCVTCHDSVLINDSLWQQWNCPQGGAQCCAKALCWVLVRWSQRIRPCATVWK